MNHRQESKISSLAAGASTYVKMFVTTKAGIIDSYIVYANSSLLDIKIYANKMSFESLQLEGLLVPLKKEIGANIEVGIFVKNNDSTAQDCTVMVQEIEY